MENYHFHSSVFTCGGEYSGPAISSNTFLFFHFYMFSVFSFSGFTDTPSSQAGLGAQISETAAARQSRLFSVLFWHVSIKLTSFSFSFSHTSNHLLCNAPLLFLPIFLLTFTPSILYLFSFTLAGGNEGLRLGFTRKNGAAPGLIQRAADR